MLIIGIDPGMENRTGYAIYEDTTKKYLLLGGCHALEVSNIAQYHGCEIAVLEDANQDGNMRYLANQVRKKQSSIERALKIANDLGKNMHCARLIAESLRLANIPTAHVKPSERHRANKIHPQLGMLARIRAYTMPTKTNRKQFEQLTGYDGRSSEHSRDAATMLWEKTSFYWKNRIKTQKLK